MIHANSPTDPREAPSLDDLRRAQTLLIGWRCDAASVAPQNIGAIEAMLFCVQAGVAAAHSEARRAKAAFAPTSYEPRPGFGGGRTREMPLSFPHTQPMTQLHALEPQVAPHAVHTELAEPHAGPGRMSASLIWAGLRAAGRP